MINFKSKDMLLPVDQFAYRTFAFTYARVRVRVRVRVRLRLRLRLRLRVRSHTGFTLSRPHSSLSRHSVVTQSSLSCHSVVLYCS